MRKKSVLICLTGLALLFTIACDTKTSVGAGELKDALLKPHHADWLDLAYEAAAALPLDPHVKDRSQAQATVAQACLTLNLPIRAQQYIEGIADWRKYLCYAELALYAAEQKHNKEAERYLSLAASNLNETEEWRRDEVQAMMAVTWQALGQEAKAKALTGQSTESGGEASNSAVILLDPEASFEEQVKKLKTFSDSGDFAVQTAVLALYVQLLADHFSDVERRSVLVEGIKASWEKQPIPQRIDTLIRMSQIAVSHNCLDVALEWIGDGQAYLDNRQWPLEYQLALASQLAVGWFRAGDPERGHSLLKETDHLYQSREQEIVDIDRAGVLRSIAEAYQSQGRTEQAIAVYQQALEAGMVNPNSRPRAEDLTATCVSMVLSQMPPNETLTARMMEIVKGLGNPW